jgi:hypothetical protein
MINDSTSKLKQVIFSFLNKTNEARDEEKHKSDCIIYIFSSISLSLLEFILFSLLVMN